MDYNIASHLNLRASSSPDQIALISPKRCLTFSQLESYTNRCCEALYRIGIRKGMRTVVMLKPGRDFLAICFSLLQLGAVIVFLDPGMGRKNLEKCLKMAAPQAFIGVPLALFACRIFGWSSDSLRIRIAVDRPGWGAIQLKSFLSQIKKGTSPHETVIQPLDTAAIAFTSGSTGVPKGVVYSHKMFRAQYRQLRDEYEILPGEVDLATFPLFSLFDPALGVTTVFPKMDFSRPGHIYAPNIIEAIQKYRVTHVFGSPALLKRIVDHYQGTRLCLDSVKRVLTAGAPVSKKVLRDFGKFLLNGEIFTPYGATEALPVSSISASEVLSLEGSGGSAGVCVGRPFNGVKVSVLNISDEPIKVLESRLCVTVGEVGELVVSGPNVSTEYFGLSVANEQAKILLNGAGIGHRMGDLGYLDDKGRIWFCGRKSHRVVTPQGILFSVPTEGVFNQHPNVARTALVGVGIPPDQKPVLCVELKKTKEKKRKTIRAELLELADFTQSTRNIRCILFRKSFPVDVRHNSKILREKLAKWAETRI